MRQQESTVCCGRNGLLAAMVDRVRAQCFSAAAAPNTAPSAFALAFAALPPGRREVVVGEGGYGVWRCGYGTDAAGAAATAVEASASREATIKKLTYRSGQRGWLEMDFLLGDWARENLPSLSDEQLAQYSLVLDEEIPDLFQWLTKQEDAPPRLEANATFVSVREYVQTRQALVSEDARTAKGAEWVRGWNDAGMREKPNHNNE